MLARNSIRSRVLAYIILTVSIALLVILFQQLNYNRTSLQNELDKRVEIHLKSVVPTLVNRLWVLDNQGIQAAIDGFTNDPDFAYAEVVDNQGNIIAKAIGNQSRDSVTARAAELVFQRKPAYLGQVYLELSHQRLVAGQRKLLYASLLLVGLTLLAVVTVIFSSFRRITKPLDQLTQTMKRLASHDLTVNVPYLERSDEIGQIAKAVEVFKHYAQDRHTLMAKQADTEKQLTYQAHYDALTGMPNRFLAMDRLSHQIEEAKRQHCQVAVLNIDIDDFKKVNDILGHEVGDRLLIETAKRLRSVVRSADTVGRLGGDEFIVILGNLHQPDEAQQVAEQLIHSLREAFKLNERELMVTASLGIAVYPDDGAATSDLLRKADSAMYHSKRLGRNTYAFFTEEMNHAVSRRLAIEEVMHLGMERREFEVCYQPLHEIASGNMIGFEALLRWRSAELGEVPPDEFIPIAEQSSLIIELGDFVLDQALQHIARWNRQFNYPLKASVNISPRQFRDPDIPGKIARALHQYAVPASSLTLELTEGVLLSSDAHSHNIMSDLSQLGVSIAMDDFGTGYSSLSYLRSFPFDILKVDRSFIDDMTNDPADFELVQAAIAMAHGLNLTVVAEGVETDEQLTLLHSMACELAQGYLFGAPMPADKMEARLLQTTSTRHRLGTLDQKP